MEIKGSETTRVLRQVDFFNSQYAECVTPQALAAIRLALGSSCLAILGGMVYYFGPWGQLLYMTNWGNQFAIVSSFLSIYTGLKQSSHSSSIEKGEESPGPKSPERYSNMINA
jgi:hypothetical protein